MTLKLLLTPLAGVMARSWHLLKTTVVRQLFIMLAVWATAVIAISYFATNELHVISTFESKAVTQANNLPDGDPPAILAGLSKWDSGWYLEIATNGYKSDPSVDKAAQQEAQKPAFYPLYPSIMKPFIMAGANPVITGIALNLVFTFGALLFLYLLAFHFLKNRTHAIRACLLFLAFPTSFYLLGVYTEALFCCLSFGAFYFALRRRWISANIMLALCTASRSAGVIVALAVLIEYLYSRGFRFSNLDRYIFAFLLAPLGLLAYMAYLWLAFGDPLLMLSAQKNWNQAIEPNVLRTIYDQTAGVALNFIRSGYNAYGTDWTREWTNFMVWALWAGAVGLAIKAWFIKSVPRSWIVYMAASLLFFISKGNFISVNRYVLVLFPIYLLVARFTAKNEQAFSLTLIVSAMFMTMGLVEFSISYWTG